MKTIRNNVFRENVIKKSKFLTYIYSVTKLREIDEILAKLRIEHKSATHICFAYVLCSPNVEKCSDDGEPSGTAGKPILDVIKKNNLVNILIVVVRYFGGVKLGAGGLIRAYSNSAKEVLGTMQIIDLSTYLAIFVKISLDNKYLIESNKNIKIIDTDYSHISDKIMCYNLLVKDDETCNKLEKISKEFRIVDRIMM